MIKLGFLALGWLALLLGLIGVVLPGLPTTPFMLVAAFAFSKGSPRLRHWLVSHPLFGPQIENWESRGAISRRSKILAVTMMVLIFAISLFILSLPLWALAAQGICLAGAAAFILTRPD